MKYLLLVIASSTLGAAIFTRLVDGAAGPSLTLAAIASMMYIGFSVGHHASR